MICGRQVEQTESFVSCVRWVQLHFAQSGAGCERWSKYVLQCKFITLHMGVGEPSWNVMVYGDAREGKWRGNWRTEWVASTLHTTSEHGVSNITTITTDDAHSTTASSRMNWRPRRFKWNRPFRRMTKSCFCACAIKFQTESTACSSRSSQAL